MATPAIDPRESALAISRGRMTLSDVPEKLRPAVQKALDHRGALRTYADNQPKRTFLADVPTYRETKTA